MMRVAFDPTGTIAHGWSGEFAVAHADDRREGLPEDLLIEAYDPTLLPERAEPFESFWVDRTGRTWVQCTGTEGEPVTLELYGADGGWLGVVRVPATGWPTEVQQRHAAWTATHVVVAVETEAGVELVRYRVERQ
jgi:hypothetical protein